MSPQHSTPPRAIVNMADPTLIDRYRFRMANARGLSVNPVQDYAGDVGRFLDWLREDGTDLADMDTLLLGRWVFDLSNAGKRRSTLKRRVAAVRSFYRFLAQAADRCRGSVPSARNYPMKIEQAQPSRLGHGEARCLLAAAYDDAPCGIGTGPSWRGSTPPLCAWASCTAWTLETWTGSTAP